MKLYFECANGISGDMAVGALLDLGANREKLHKVLKSLNLDNEFSYEISETKINSIKATDFNVIYNEDKIHHHHQHMHNEHHIHRNLNDVINIINNADMTQCAKELAKKIFNIVAEAESKVHGLPIDKVHFHEVGAIDSIVDIISFSVLYDDLKPDKAYFKTLTEGQGIVKCAHGEMNVPVPAVAEIASQYEIPLKITVNDGEMVTPTGIAIAASLYNKEIMPETIMIKRIGYGSGKRPYKNPVLRVFEIE